MAFPGQTTSTIIAKEPVERNIVHDSLGNKHEITKWEITTRVRTFVGFAIVNGQMCARHDHKIVKTYETQTCLVAQVVHHGHYRGHHVAASPFPGLKPTPHPMAILPAPVIGPAVGPAIDPAMAMGLRPPYHAMW